jgi:hypothetical protein
VAAITTTNTPPATATRISAATAAALRIGAILVGCAAIGWGAIMLPFFWRSSVLEETARRILRGEIFEPQALLAQLDELPGVADGDDCRPSALRSVAIIRFRLAEAALEGGAGLNVDDSLTAFRRATEKSLSCSPADSFLWLGLFWAKVNTEGFKPEDLALLRMSYAQGPNEGWIMRKRNRLALALYPVLPPDLAERALDEFVLLVQPAFVPDAVDIFTGPGWPIRELLLARMAKAAENDRQYFSDILYSRGYNIAVPGITRKQQPWH